MSERRSSICRLMFERSAVSSSKTFIHDSAAGDEAKARADAAVGLASSLSRATLKWCKG
jgi:hypothetical protein